MDRIKASGSVSRGAEERARFGQGIHHPRRPILDNLLHHIAQPLLRDALGQRVHRDDAIGVQAFHFHGFPIGAVHHQPAQILIDFARNRNGIALFEAVCQPGLVEERQAQSGRPIADDDFDDRSFAVADGT